MSSKKYAILSIFRGKLAKVTMGTLILNIAEAGIGFLTATVLARTLGASGYGIYSYSIVLAGTLVIFSLLGNDKLTIREISSYCASNNNEKIPNFVTGVYVRVGLMCSVISLIAFLLILYSNDIKSPRSSALLVGIVLIGLTAFMKVHIGLLQGIKQVIYSIIPDKLIRPSVFLIIILLLSADSQFKLSPFLAVLANAVAAFIALLLILYFWKKMKPYQKQLHPSMTSLKKDWRPALPFALLAGLSVINTNTDVIMLGMFSTDEDIGIYRISSRVATLISFALVAINTVIAPRISGLYRQQNFSELQTLVSKSALGAALVGLPCFLLFVFAGDWVLIIFGEEFQAGYSTLSILSIGQFANAITGSVGLLLLMTSYANLAAVGLTVGAILNIVLNWFLIPIYGAEGAAVTTATTLGLINIIQTYWVWKHLKLNASVFSYLIYKYK